MAKLGKDNPTEVPFTSHSPSKEAEQPVVVEKKADTTKEVAPDATKPSVVPQDPHKEKEVPPRLEIVLATLPMPAKGDLQGKGPKALEATLSQSTKASRNWLVTY